VLGYEIKYPKMERGCSDLQLAKKRQKTAACKVAHGVHARKEWSERGKRVRRQMAVKIWVLAGFGTAIRMVVAVLFQTQRKWEKHVAMLFQNKIPKKYWGEAVLTASYLINCLPSCVLDSKTPMDVLSSFYPDLSTSSNLTPRIFGCTSFVHIHSDGRGKLDSIALKCVFIGYSSTQKDYKCYHPPSHKFFVSRDVTFHEQESYFVQTHL